MRSNFTALFVFLLCFFEIVLGAPSPLGVKARAVGRKSTPLKKVTLEHNGVSKKSPAKKNPKSKTKPAKNVGTERFSCPMRKAGPKAKVAKREDEEFGLTRRTASEFLGFHGTSSGTAAQYTAAGRAGKHLPILGSGFNGNDAELGPGLYVTDHVETAMFFAISAANARKVKGENVTPMVCMVEAIGTTAWRTQTPKIWVPHDKVAKLIGGKNNIAKLKEQEALATCAGYKPSETVRFSPLDIANIAAGRPPKSGNQFAIPTTQFNKIYIRTCMDVTGKTEAQVLAFFNQQGWPDYDFSSDALRQSWHIV